MGTVYIEASPHSPNVCHMIWTAPVAHADIHDAFANLTEILEHADESISVVVFLKGSIQFPLKMTVQSALPCHKHPYFKAWLVVGKNDWLARMIGTVLSNYGKGKIHWFESEAEVEQYLVDEGYPILNHSN